MGIRTIIRIALVTAVAVAASGISGAFRQSKAAGPHQKVTIGRLERVWIEKAGIVLKAKIDTGSQTSSLGARNIELFKKDGRNYVRFTIEDPSHKPSTLELPVARFARFKEEVGRTAPTRPVVVLGLCIGNIYRRTQVNLTDRGRFDYPLLIGRRFLFGYAVVDVAKMYTAPPHCKQMSVNVPH